MSDASAIHATAVVEDGVTIGAGCVIHPYVVLRAGTTLGERVTVHAFSVIGGEPQDIGFKPETPSGVRIGAGTVIREQSTVNRATKEGGETVVGEGCYLMATSHVGHDVRLGNKVIFANGVMIGGFAEIGDNAFLGGGSAVHQFCRVGEGAMIGGGAIITESVPHFAMAADRNEVIGLNLVGLKRRGMAREAIRELKEAFREVYFTPGNIREVAARAIERGAFKTPEALRFLEFFTTGKRRFARARREGPVDDADES